MDDDVCIASNGRREVSVERNIEGIMFEEPLVLHLTAAEVERHLDSAEKKEPGYKPLQMVYVEITYACSTSELNWSNWSLSINCKYTELLTCIGLEHMWVRTSFLAEDNSSSPTVAMRLFCTLEKQNKSHNDLNICLLNPF